MSEFQSATQTLLQSLDAIDPGPLTFRIVGYEPPVMVGVGGAYRDGRLITPEDRQAESKRLHEAQLQREREDSRAQAAFNARWEAAKSRADEYLSLAVRSGIDTSNNPLDWLTALNDQQRRQRDAVAEAITKARAWVQATARKIVAGDAKPTNGELGVMQSMVKVSEAARLSGIDDAIISRAVTSGKIESNGEKGADRRINVRSFMTWYSNRPEKTESDAAVDAKFRALEHDQRRN